MAKNNLTFEIEKVEARITEIRSVVKDLQYSNQRRNKLQEFINNIISISKSDWGDYSKILLGKLNTTDYNKMWDQRAIYVVKDDILTFLHNIKEDFINGYGEDNNDFVEYNLKNINSYLDKLETELKAMTG